MQAIAGPFVVTYMLRDLKLSYLAIGLMTAVTTVCVLASSSFWGKMVDRYGCKPILILGTAVIVPLPFTWIWVNDTMSAYIILPLVNVIVGFASAGISVALSTLIYNVTPTAGRSVQFAVYSIVVTLLAAPMPAIGGLMPGWIKAMGLHTDIRCTFYATMVFTFSSLLIAARIPEIGAKSVKELSIGIRSHLRYRFTRQKSIMQESND
jgi:MFS family permease